MIGADCPLGHAVMKVLKSSSEIEVVRGLAAQSRSDDPGSEDLEFIPVVSDHRPLADFIERENVDTVVQCDLVADRSGLGARSQEADVIATICAGAAIGQAGSSVRAWILASSSAIYPIASDTALLQRESQVSRRNVGSLSASIAEAEDYVRDVAERQPHVNVAILRLQQVVGRDARGPLAALLARDPVPMPLGFDPAIQLLHLDDAASAMVFAVKAELAGIYNVASAGVIRWRDAVRRTGHRRIPVLPFSTGPVESILLGLGLPVVPAELLDLVRFGHAVDIGKLMRAGWSPHFTQKQCVELLCHD